MSKILVIAPHMDDEVLGCGGTIKKHVEFGDSVFVCFVAHRIYGHKFDNNKNEVEKNCSVKAKKILGYREAIYLNLDDEKLDTCLQDIIIPLENYFGKIKPEIVYCPFYGDNNQDHRAVFNAARVVFRPSATNYVKEILMYETPSSTEQSPQTTGNIFSPNYYINIEKYIDKKIESFKCYETEIRKFPHPRSEEALRVLAKKRGVEICFLAAEAFMSLRNKWE